MSGKPKARRRPPKKPKLPQPGTLERRALEALARRRQTERKFRVEDFAFPEQAEFILHPSKAKALYTSRRAGKTTTFAIGAVNSGLEHPGSQVPYITLTRPQARRNFWPPLREVLARAGLKAKFYVQEGIVRLENGSEIFIVGADDRAEIEKLRGGKFPICMLDEVQAFRSYIIDLVELVLEPCLQDYNGALWMGGTPDTICEGFFYEATTRSETGWDVFHWTAEHNPFIQHGTRLEPGSEEHARRLKMIRLRVLGKNRWTWETPRFQTEYLGKWVRDDSLRPLVLGPLSVIDRFEAQQGDDWQYVLGADIGAGQKSVEGTTGSPDAFLVMAESNTRRHSVVVESHEKRGLTVAGFASEIQRLREAYDFTAIRVDPGGLGGKIIEELNQVYGIPAEAAPKKAGYKVSAIHMLNSDLASGQIRIVKNTNRELLADISRLRWNDARSDFARRCDDHLADAFIYASMACSHRYSEDQKELPPLGSSEWVAEQARQMRQAAFDRVKKAREFLRPLVPPKWAGGSDSEDPLSGMN